MHKSFGFSGLNVAISYDYTTYHQLTSTPPSTGNVDWSPDKKLLIYGQSIELNNSLNYEIWTMRYDGHKKAKINRKTTIWTRAKISPSGNKIIFVETYDNMASEIITTDINGENYTQILSSNSLPQKDWCYIWDPCWKSNDNEISFLFQEKKSSIRGIGLYNLQSLSIEYFTFLDSLKPMSFQWSPVRDEIVFLGNGDKHDLGVQIWIVNIDGTNLRKVSKCFLAGVPDWSPDGEKVIFDQQTESLDDKFTIWAVNRDGSGAEKLMEDSVSLINPAW